ncbi:FKBP-type peptidyl-prolyl cis-trans isomerase [Belliella baltica DSM 15883]|uniref:Peptidyl-prolyl cis-trans isomerase n=1 Tax=Belliella baltica (strain DSM 15883 / CIP 108006 / LMG 21964 / BA134) TaxID=866536 RepID=I3Z4D5_BELBD|nr:FKBP-type peptidyl-prolyl cis-trans isomerase [Belliella baltica]AFL84103.1 FKBP-type peptidyl-prolyl cis-trans isomerase [Belliella baltica DSM 15883]
MKRVSLIVFAILIALSSCEQQNPFGGPVYDFEGNLAKDSLIIEDYLRNNPIAGDIIRDPSGVVIIVQEEGEGSRPVSNTVVYTDYTGSLLDGSVFDTSYEAVAIENDIFQESRTYSPLVFTIPPPGVSGGNIQGFNFGFRRLRPKSKAVLLIPSPLGYRDDDDRENIPPNSVLRFDVDFRGID